MWLQLRAKCYISFINCLYVNNFPEYIPNEDNTHSKGLGGAF